MTGYNPVPDDCPHCDPVHGDPNRRPWHVRVGSEVDGDGQPVRLIVQPTNGAHVAPSDARWLKRLIDRTDLSAYVNALAANAANAATRADSYQPGTPERIAAVSQIHAYNWALRLAAEHLGIDT